MSLRVGIAAGVALLSAAPLSFELDAPLLIFTAGFLGMGVYLAMHFGKVVERRRG